MKILDDFDHTHTLNRENQIFCFYLPYSSQWFFWGLFVLLSDGTSPYSAFMFGIKVCLCGINVFTERKLLFSHDLWNKNLPNFIQGHFLKSISVPIWFELRLGNYDFSLESSLCEIL